MKEGCADALPEQAGGGRDEPWAGHPRSQLRSVREEGGMGAVWQDANGGAKMRLEGEERGDRMREEEQEKREKMDGHGGVQWGVWGC